MLSRITIGLRGFILEIPPFWDFLRQPISAICAGIFPRNLPKRHGIILCQTPLCYQMKRIKTFYGLLSLLTLIVGMVIYLLFRDLNNIILFAWISKPQFLKTILVPLQPSIFADILRCNLPDMLWFVSAVLLLRFIWFYKAKEQTAYIWCFYGIALALEIGQLSEKVPGTFDWLDLLFFGIGAFVEGLLYKIFITRRII